MIEAHFCEVHNVSVCVCLKHLMAELAAERLKSERLQVELDYERASKRSWARKAIEEVK